MGPQRIVQNLMFAYMNDLILSRFLCGMIADWLREQGREQEADLITGPTKRIVVHYTEQPVPAFALMAWTLGDNGPWSFELWLEDME